MTLLDSCRRANRDNKIITNKKCGVSTIITDNNKMNSKKIKKSYVLLTLLFATTLFFPTCKQDKCKDVTCQNGGTCNDGKCTCPAGYEGTFCETKTVDKLVGNYSVSGMGTYTTCTITASASFVDRVDIIFPYHSVGFGPCAELAIYATVSGNSFTIPSQTLPTRTISGSGSISSTSSSLVISLTCAISGGGNINCVPNGTNIIITLTKL